jgi:hypothetical protein
LNKFPVLDPEEPVALDKPIEVKRLFPLPEDIDVDEEPDTLTKDKEAFSLGRFLRLEDSSLWEVPEEPLSVSVKVTLVDPEIGELLDKPTSVEIASKVAFIPQFEGEFEDDLTEKTGLAGLELNDWQCILVFFEGVVSLLTFSCCFFLSNVAAASSVKVFIES